MVWHKYLLCIKPVKIKYGLPRDNQEETILPAGKIVWIEEVSTVVTIPNDDRFYGDIMDAGGKMFRLKAKYGSIKMFKTHFKVL